jgi:hypothetical protein
MYDVSCITATSTERLMETSSVRTIRCIGNNTDWTANLSDSQAQESDNLAVESTLLTILQQILPTDEAATMKLPVVEAVIHNNSYVYRPRPVYEGSRCSRRPCDSV